jgi:hypothetical protein
MSTQTHAGGARHASWLASPPPSAAIEISSRHVAAVAIAAQGGGSVISGYGAEPLPAGAVEPGLNAVNIHDAATLTGSIRAALDKISPRPRRIALVLPDTVAKVSLIRFEKVPVKAQDLDQLIRWQVRKAAPFRIEDAQVSWVPGVAIDGGGREFIVTVARKDLIAGYEKACEAAGAHAGDWLLVHIGADYATLAVVRGPDLVFFRNRGAAGPAEFADLVHQTSMYHEDRLGGGGFARVVLTGAALRGPDQADWIRRSIEERLASKIESLDFRNTVPIRDRIGAGPELLDALAPALGVLLRERLV